MGNESTEENRNLASNASPAGKISLETAVEFLPRPRRPGLSMDLWLRPKPAKTDHFFAGVNIRLAKPVRLYSPGDCFRSCRRCEERILGGSPAARSGVGRSDFRVEAEERVCRRLGLRVRIAVHGGRKALHTLEHAAQPSEPGRSQSRFRTHRLAYASPHLQGVARRQLVSPLRCRRSSCGTHPSG